MIQKQPSEPKPPKTGGGKVPSYGVSVEQFGNTCVSGLHSQKFSDGNSAMFEPGGRTTIYVIENGVRMRMNIEPDRTLTQESIPLSVAEH